MAELLTDAEQQCLVRAAQQEAEQAGDLKIQFELDLQSTLCLIGNLQLSLRHPLNNGPSSRIARQIIDDIRDGLIDRGFGAHAKMIELGDDRSYDYDPRDNRPSRIAVVPKRPRSDASESEPLAASPSERHGGTHHGK